MLFKKTPKDKENEKDENINKNIIEENFFEENLDLEEDDDSITAVFEDKSSILTMLFLFILMIIFVLFIFFKINS